MEEASAFKRIFPLVGLGIAIIFWLIVGVWAVQKFNSPKVLPREVDSELNQVFKKSISALEKGDSEDLYNLLAPGLKNLFSAESFFEGMKLKIQNQGKILKVKIVSYPVIKSRQKKRILLMVKLLWLQKVDLTII